MPNHKASRHTVTNSNSRCFVKRAKKVRNRAQRLKVEKNKPIAVYRDNNGKVRYISDKDVEKVLRDAAKVVHKITSASDLAKWSCHSIRVGACVRLQQLGKPAHFIQSRLRWRSEAWRDYLRNLPELADVHNEVIAELANTIASA